MSFDNQVETHPVVDLDEFRHYLAAAYRILIKNSIQNHLPSHRMETSNNDDRNLIDGTSSTNPGKPYSVE